MTRAIWFWLALLSFICSTVFLLYLEHYLEQQSDLIKKNVRFGFSDLAIIPYLKIVTLFSSPVMVGISSSWYRRELNSSFSPLFLSLNYPVWHVVIAKTVVLLTVSLIIIVMLFLPILVFSVYAELALDYSRFYHSATMIWAIMSIIGLFSAWLSCRFSGSVWGMFIALSVLGLTELLARLITEPLILTQVLRYLSPYYHVYGVANGVLTLSNLAYVFSVASVCIFLTVVQIRRQYYIR